jgi:hypothetical protein
MDCQFPKGGLVLAYKVAESVCSYLLIATCFVLSAQSCKSTKSVRSTNVAQEAPQKTDLPKGEVASYKLQIDVSNGKCVLRYDGPQKGEVDTELSAPCEFSREQTGTIKYHEYKNRGAKGEDYTVVLVIGGPSYPTRSDKYMKEGCGTEVLPISLSPRGIAKGAVGSLLFACPSEDLDEKIFGFGARPV